MNGSMKTGLSFGLTSATITTLGLTIGLYSSTSSKALVISGILLIAIADSFSDSLGVHLSEEFKDGQTERGVWEATVYTFAAKFLFALTYIIPFQLFSMKTAIIIDIVWGYLLLSLLSYFIARNAKKSIIGVVSEHLLVVTIVVLATHYTGVWISNYFQ